MLQPAAFVQNIFHMLLNLIRSFRGGHLFGINNLPVCTYINTYLKQLLFTVKEKHLNGYYHDQYGKYFPYHQVGYIYR